MSESGTIAVIALDGELEIGRKEELRDALRLDANAAAVLLDFSNVTYADSTALAELLRFRVEAGRRDVPVAILTGNEQFSRIVAYAGLGDAFALFQWRAEALSYLASARDA